MKIFIIHCINKLSPMQFTLHSLPEIYKWLISHSPITLASLNSIKEPNIIQLMVDL